MEIELRNENLEGLKREAKDYISLKMSHMSMSDRIKASRLGKRLVLGINAFYKSNKDPFLMDLMKSITEKKRKFEKTIKRFTIDMIGSLPKG